MTVDSSARSMLARLWPRDGGGSLQRFSELLGLSGLLFAQPLYSIHRDGADMFVWQRADNEVVWWTAAILVLPASVLFAAQLLVRIVNREMARIFHALLIGVLGGLLVSRTAAQSAIEPGQTTSSGVALVVVLGLCAGLGFFMARVARHRFADGFRTWLQILAVAPVLMAGSFLFTSPIRDIALDGAGATPESVRIEDPPPMLFIIYDELPLASLLGESDAVDRGLLPNFARLADESTLYRNITTVSPASPTAVPAILTGRYPLASDVPPVAASYPNNLFSILAGSYGFNVWESVARLCPPEKCSRSGADLPAMLEEAATIWLEGFLPIAPEEQEPYKPPQSQPRAPYVFEDFIESLPRRTAGGTDDSAASDGAPRFDFIHIILPHQPWYHLPSGSKHNGPFLTPGLEGSTYAWRDEYLSKAGRQRHLLQLVRTDALLGELIDRMEAAGTWDDTLVVVASDHGVNFTSGEPIRGVSDKNFEQIMWVPLFIKHPGQTTGRLDDTPGRVIDIVPTLADILGAEIPWDIDGVSLDGPRPEDVESRRMLKWAFNELVPEQGGQYLTVDGVEGFRRLLELPAATEPGDDPLKPWRFGEWGHLVGEELDSLDITTPSRLVVDLEDPSCARAKKPDVAAAPSYICGTMEAGEPADIVVAVNGIVGGWGRSRPMKAKGMREFHALVPDELFSWWANTEREGEEDLVEVFEVVPDPGSPGGLRLAPVEIS